MYIKVHSYNIAFAAKIFPTNISAIVTIVRCLVAVYFSMVTYEVIITIGNYNSENSAPLWSMKVSSNSNTKFNYRKAYSFIQQIHYKLPITFSGEIRQFECHTRK